MNSAQWGRTRFIVEGLYVNDERSPGDQDEMTPDGLERLTSHCLMAWRLGDHLAAAAIAQQLLYAAGDLRDQLLGEAAACPGGVTWEQIGAAFGMDPEEARAHLEGGFPGATS